VVTGDGGCIIIGFAAALAGCFNLASAAAQGTTDYAQLLAAPDRSAADRATDGSAVQNIKTSNETKLEAGRISYSPRVA
jgi:hypothetical protein